MVTTRSLSNYSQPGPGPNNHPTISGRIEKPKNSPQMTRKKASKRATGKTPKTKAQGDMSAEDCEAAEAEAESKLMRQISLGEVSLQEHRSAARHLTSLGPQGMLTFWLANK